MKFYPPTSGNVNLLVHSTSRTPDSPPYIPALSSKEERPLISVMIPAYNCISYIGETIKSVLRQDLGPELMQIEVNDDCSTDGNLEALVRTVGQGRVSYNRHSSNIGSLRNYESCINRAKGHWVHILHGDDFVLPGFYDTIKNLITRYPQAGAAFTNNFYLGNDLTKLSEGTRLREQEGILDNWLEEIATNNKLQTPAIVVKRSVYEHLGGFFAVHYGEDWEMWTRIAAHYPFAYSPHPLAVYRAHESNISSASFNKGKVAKDLTKVITILQDYLPDDRKQEIKIKSRKIIGDYFTSVYCELYNRNKVKGNSFLLQLKTILKMHFSIKNALTLAKAYVKHSIGWNTFKEKQLTSSLPPYFLQEKERLQNS